MKFSPKIIKKKDGGAEIRLSIQLSREEISSLDRIPDDPNIDSTLSILRGGGPSLGSRVDFYLCYLRIILHWVDAWNDRDNLKEHIMRAVEARQRAQSRTRRKRKR